MAVSSEIEELRAQLKNLEERVNQRAKRVGPSDAGPMKKASTQSPASGAPSVLEHAKEIAQEWHLPEATEKLGEFLATLGSDIKASPPRALVAAFLAGFVAGKVASR